MKNSILFRHRESCVSEREEVEKGGKEGGDRTLTVYFSRPFASHKGRMYDSMALPDDVLQAVSEYPVLHKGSFFYSVLNWLNWWKFKGKRWTLIAMEWGTIFHCGQVCS